MKIKQHILEPLKLRERRIVTLQQRSLESDVFKILRTKILKQLRDNNYTSFAVTAPTQGAGKSLIAANLAVAISMDLNQSVLLIDFDLVYPRIYWYFDLKVEKSLKDYVLHDASIDEILIKPNLDRLLILPNTGEVFGTSEVISSPKMRELIANLKKKHPNTIFIFDLPPVLAGDDVLVSMEYYEALLIVIEDGINTPNEIKQALQITAEKELLGTVLNKASTLPEHQRYYYGMSK